MPDAATQPKLPVPPLPAGPVFVVRRPRRIWEPWLIHGLPVLGLLLVAVLLKSLPPGWWPFVPCTFRALTGYPCPFCGVMRALRLWLCGEWWQALVFCPLSLTVLLGLVGLFVWNLAGLVSGRIIVPGRWLHGRRLRILLWSIGLLATANWVYRLAMNFC